MYTIQMYQKNNLGVTLCKSWMWVELQSDLCMLMIWLDFYLFGLIARRESGVLGERGWLLTRERAAHCTVNSSWSQQKRSLLTETQVRQESFSALCPFVLTSVIVKSIRNWNHCPAPGWHDTPEEEGKEMYWKMRQKCVFTWVSSLD